MLREWPLLENYFVVTYVMRPIVHIRAFFLAITGAVAFKAADKISDFGRPLSQWW